ELDRPRRLARTQDGHDVRERHWRELAADEVANLERGQVLAEQNAELGVHFLRETRSAGRAAATTAATPASSTGRRLLRCPRGACASRTSGTRPASGGTASGAHCTGPTATPSTSPRATSASSACTSNALHDEVGGFTFFRGHDGFSRLRPALQRLELIGRAHLVQERIGALIVQRLERGRPLLSFGRV